MDKETILLDHGSGGKISHNLISKLMIPYFDDPALAKLDDGAVLDMEKGRLAFSTDTYVVDPIFFPGGNIGDLAVNGTVNDIAMCGAIPLFMSMGMIIEEGFSMALLEKIIKTMSRAGKNAGIRIVTGDTKVVPKGAADKIFINTSGIGKIPPEIDVSGANAGDGDIIILSGTMADHGMTILTQREEMEFEANIKSDTAPLNHLVKKILDAHKENIHVLRDPTRGGVGTALNEIAMSSEVGIEIEEKALPVRDEVKGICNLLGFDPLYVANEGKMLVFARPDCAKDILGIMRRDKYGKDAAIIGKVVAGHPGKVFMKTFIGGTRIVDMLTGEQLPRIC